MTFVLEDRSGHSYSDRGCYEKLIAGVAKGIIISDGF